jgi:hypothetical protein
LRFRFFDFEVIICAWYAFSRFKSPLPVTLKRFLAPDFVFIFGIDSVIETPLTAQVPTWFDKAPVAVENGKVGFNSLSIFFKARRGGVPKN